MAGREFKGMGCGCRNVTKDIEQALSGTGTNLVDAPCCDAWPDGTPCRYALIFECFHDWPLWYTDESCGRVPFGVLRNWDGSEFCTIPSPLGLTFPVMEVIRECLPDITGECSFTNRLYNNSIHGVDVFTHMAPSWLADLYPDAVAGKFPPYSRVDDGPITYHRADFGRSVAYPGYGSDTEVNTDEPSCQHEEDGTTLWKLTIGTSPAVLEWVYDFVLDQMTRFAGTGTGTGTGTGDRPNPHRPRYHAIDAWNLWGRNTMQLQNPEDWPSLPPFICVAALDRGHFDNPCDSHETQCACCDTGGDAATVGLTVTGCDTLAGTYTGAAVRITDPGDLEAGVEMPESAPCGIFWALLGDSGTCDIDGTNWSGQIGLVIWCDGSTYKVRPYCLNADTAEYVAQDEATVTAQECTCDGVNLSFTMPEDLDCCCPVVQNCADCGGQMVDITIPPFGSSPGGLWDLLCPSGWNPPATDTVLTCEFGDVGIGCATGSSPQIAVTSLVCVDGVATLTLRIQCGSLSTSTTYTLADGCEGTYSITSASSTFPATVTVVLA